MNISIYPPLPILEIGQRDNQEDAIWPLLATEEDRFFVLCDGMGGHEHGEVASQTVTQALGYWYKTKAVHPIDDSQLEEALAYAYVQLDQKDSGEFRKMGTTLTLLYIGQNGVIAVHMGDSRIYHVRPSVGVLYQSRDHSIAFDLFQAGEITLEELFNYPQKNIVTRAMTPGDTNRMHPDVIHITDIQPNDYFYMCSDGMIESMNNQEIVSILTMNNNDEEKKAYFIEKTKNNKDNHSAWIIHVKEIEKENDDLKLSNEELTARCNVVVSMPEIMNAKSDNNEDVVVVMEGKKNIFQKIKDFLYKV